jgi:hypothetical protein
MNVVKPAVKAVHYLGIPTTQFYITFKNPAPT